MPEEAESAMAACSEAPAHLGRYEWTQTKEDLTITVALPPGTSTKQVTCRVSTDDTRAIELTIAGAPVPLLQGYLHAKARRSVWWIEAGTTFILDIEKHRPRFWKCALVGGPQVDVSALVEQHRRDNEPACQPDPALQQAPRRPRRVHGTPYPASSTWRSASQAICPHGWTPRPPPRARAGWRGASTPCRTSRPRSP